MANGFGSLYVGSSGLRSAQNAINVVANNLTNVDTKGYVRQQVIFEDRNYNQFDNAAVSKQLAGNGVDIGDVAHIRDEFIDRTYRTTVGKEEFYGTCYEATQEVENLLRELSGAGYSDTINDLYEAMSEFGKIPADSANQSMLVQTASLWLTQTKAIYDSIKDYQVNLNTKITDDVDRINQIGSEINKLNKQIQRIEAAGVETAMDLRDARDYLIDELSGMAYIEYGENANSQVWVKLEGTYLVTDARNYTISTYTDSLTGFKTPYWEQLSDLNKLDVTEDDYYKVFRIEGIDPTKKNDVGELKALLLSRGNDFATYLDIKDLDSYTYNKFLSGSVAMNTQAEFDLFVNNLVTSINELLSPTTELSNTSDYQDILNNIDPNSYDATTGVITGKGLYGEDVRITANTRVLDMDNVILGSSGTIPPYELFERTGCDRFTPVILNNADGSVSTLYVYNEEDAGDISKCYSVGSLHITEEVDNDASQLSHKYSNGNIAYDMGERFSTIWDDKDYHLNPDDVTPCSFTEFYVKLIGDLSNRGSVHRTTSQTLSQAVESVDASRLGVIGVSSDEELVNMIRFQNAYNASSRYMSVISQMIEHLVTQL